MPAITSYPSTVWDGGTVSNDATFLANITVDGTATFNGPIALGDVEIDNATVAGLTTTNTLSVVSTSTLGGLVTANAGVSTTAVTASGLTTTNTLSVTSTSTLGGLVTANTGISVNGAQSIIAYTSTGVTSALKINNNIAAGTSSRVAEFYMPNLDTATYAGIKIGKGVSTSASIQYINSATPRAYFSAAQNTDGIPTNYISIDSEGYAVIESGASLTNPTLSVRSDVTAGGGVQTVALVYCPGITTSDGVRFRMGKGDTGASDLDIVYTQNASGATATFLVNTTTFFALIDAGGTDTIEIYEPTTFEDTVELDGDSALFVVRRSSAAGSILPLEKLYYTNATTNSGIETRYGTSDSRYGCTRFILGASASADNIRLIPDTITGTSYMRLNGDGACSWVISGTTRLSLTTASLLDLIASGSGSSVGYRITTSAAAGQSLNGLQCFYTNAGTGDNINIRIGVSSTDCSEIRWVKGATNDELRILPDNQVSTTYFRVVEGGGISAVVGSATMFAIGSTGIISAVANVGGVLTSASPQIAAYNNWSPTITQLTGTSVSGISVLFADWFRMQNNRVYFAVRFSCTQGTVSIAETQTFSVTLPFSNNFSSANQATGIATGEPGGGVEVTSSSVNSDATNDYLVLSLRVTAGSGATTFDFNGVYTVI